MSKGLVYSCVSCLQNPGGGHHTKLQNLNFNLNLNHNLPSNTGQPKTRATCLLLSVRDNVLTSSWLLENPFLRTRCSLLLLVIFSFFCLLLFSFPNNANCTLPPRVLLCFVSTVVLCLFSAPPLRLVPRRQLHSRSLQGRGWRTGPRSRRGQRGHQWQSGTSPWASVLSPLLRSQNPSCRDRNHRQSRAATAKRCYWYGFCGSLGRQTKREITCTCCRCFEYMYRGS